MILCQNCGQNNSKGSNFCRFCGNKFQQIQQNIPKTNNEVFKQPELRRPYSWQTDEFQVKDQSTRPTQQIESVKPLENKPQNVNHQLNNATGNHQHQMMQPQYQNTLSSGYRCRFCNTNAMPIIEKKVSPAGWAVFTALLITTVILFWIGLLIQEECQICPECRMRVG